MQQIFGEEIPLNLTPQASVRYIDRCREALDELDPDDAVLALKLRTAEVVVAAQSGIEMSAETVHQLEDLAQRVGGEIARVHSLVAWCMMRQAPEYAEDRVAAASEILEVAERCDETWLVPVGHLLLLVGLLEHGEIRSLDVRILEQQDAAAGSSSRCVASPVRWFHCLRSILDGDTVGAEEQAEAIFADADSSGTEAFALYTTQIGMIRWMQGRVDGAEEGFLAARREYPGQLLWAASLAWLWLLQGRRESGETLLRTLPALADIPRDRYWLSTMTVLAEIARIDGPRDQAAELQRLLEPFANRLVAVGVGVAFWGTVARTLGLLEERLGMLDAARAHLELAIEMSGRIGALAWHAEAQIELAEFAIRHELADIPAYELLAEARATSDARGFTALSRRAMHRPLVRVLGRFEVISLCGTRAEWSSRKARELLKMLVASRGVATPREVFMESLWPGIAPSRLSNRFSVAINAIRRALDPNRMQPTQHHLETDGDSVRLRLEHLDIDLERFLVLARRGDENSKQAALRLYTGDAFSDELYADWAQRIRDHAKHIHLSLA